VLPEQLVFLALFLLFALLNLIVRLFRERAAKPPDTAPPPLRRPPPPRPPEPLARPAPARVAQPPAPAPVVPGPAAPALAAPAAAPARRRPRARLGGPRDLRRAVVLMTVLGPCRALEAEEREAPRARERR
jgi:hypothetical protein